MNLKTLTDKEKEALDLVAKIMWQRGAYKIVMWHTAPKEERSVPKGNEFEAGFGTLLFHEIQ